MNQEPPTAESRSGRILPWLGLVALAVLAVGQLRLERRQEVLSQKVYTQARLLEQFQATAAAWQHTGEQSPAPVSAHSLGNPSPGAAQITDARLTALELRLQKLGAISPSAFTGPSVPEYDPAQPVEEPPEPEPAPEQKRSWSAWQATGQPNTLTAGDAATAWAPLGQDTGAEWLRVEFGREVEAVEVRVRENFNAGAIVRVTALMNGAEISLWEGTSSPSKRLRDFVIRPGPGVVARTFTIYLDTAGTPGWNEIDAVELVGRDGSRQWAVSAHASTSYGAQWGNGHTSFEELNVRLTR